MHLTEHEELYQFMKKKRIIRVRDKELEMELHPSAFHMDAIDLPPQGEKEKDQYEEFLFPEEPAKEKKFINPKELETLGM